MTESAPTLREQKSIATARRLRMTARAWAADRGLAGFTIEELCAEVGVSRRTFFNYFASKENAVIGIPLKSDDSDLDDEFLAGTGPLVDDLLERAVRRWERLEISGDEVPDLIRVLEHEPRLVTHVVGLVEESDRDDIELVERRLSIRHDPDRAPDLAATTTSPDDVRAVTAVHLVGGLVRAVGAQFFAPDNTATYRTLAGRRLATARALLAD
ncbi:TetR/AcrR family transcriptional regulator [Schumannella luteola]|uniref:AcrR family transcriptional regulator n=1 Tax=Schumannella luteola TaxID=472059 RepID=A0A852Y7Z9_9MICO|nr:TetR/AcrR family transcriptional regulator [Schumannella luteola]NYG98503.1 AcrR family transcriptional regulator [Schumannella luteola]TPX01273.1 TetR/AcrR family transcriptional regulator [Schumannella luteola]